MTRYESKPTPRRNIGVSYVSQELADAQAAAMDASNCLYCSGCSGCSNCSDCSYCSNCSNCSGCSGCSNCSDCSYCSNCSDCSYCSNCSDCSNCLYCSDCSDCSNCSDCSYKANIGPAPAKPEEAIANLDRVREIVLDDSKRLEMGHWHGDKEWKNRSCVEETLCGTTHCLAGWLQVCATEPELRDLDSVQTAGFLAAPIAAKMFFRGSKEVLSWLDERKYVAEYAAKAPKEPA